MGMVKRGLSNHASNKQIRAVRRSPAPRLFDAFRGDSRGTPSDDLIDGFWADELTVGGQNKDITGYFDEVELTDNDREILADLQCLAGIYKETSKMVKRILKLATRKDKYQHRQGAKDPTSAGSMATGRIESTGRGTGFWPFARV